MIVLAIDHDDIDGCSSQCLGGVQATEACTDDHHLWSLLRHCIFPGVCSRSWGWNIKQAKRRDRRVGHTKCQQTNCGQQGIFWVSSVAASKKSNREKYLRLTLH